MNDCSALLLSAHGNDVSTFMPHYSIESLKLDPDMNGSSFAAEVLRTRGPIHVDMPVYTLRGYTLHSSQWIDQIEFPNPAEEYIIKLSIMRPTGFSAMSYSYSAEGEVIP